MTRIVLPAQIFHYLGGLMMAVLMTRGRFLPSAMAPLIYNLCIIVAGVILAPIVGMHGFALGALIGSFLGPFLIPLLMVRPYIKYKPNFNFRDKAFKQYWLLTLPLILGVSLTTVDEWFGRVIGATMEEGSISWLNYARRLTLVPIALIGQAAGQAALPYLSRLAAAGESKKLAEVLQKTLHNVILLSFVATALFVVASEQGVAFIYQRGAFTQSDTQTTATLLEYFSFGIVAWTIQMVVVRAYYAEKNTFTPMVLTTIITILSIPLYYGLSQWMGVAGLAIASSAAMGMQALVVMLFYRRKNAHFTVAPLLKSMAQSIGVALFTAGGAFLGLWLWKFLDLSLPMAPSLVALLQIAIAGVIGLLFTAMAMAVICPADFRFWAQKLRRRKTAKGP